MPNSSLMKFARSDRISFGHPSNSPFPNHTHRFNSLQGSPRTLKRAVALGQPSSLLDGTMVLLHNVIQILALPQATTTAQRAFRLECLDCRWIRRILIHIDHPWLGIARCAQSLTNEAFRGRRIALGGEQKLNGLPGRIRSPIQVFVLAFNLYIGLVDAVALVSRLQMLTTSLVQLWRVRLHPTPDAAGIYRYAPFRYDLGDMLVSQRISKVPTHTQKDQFARVLASLERIGWRDRHAIPAYQTSSETSQWNPQ